MKLIHLADLHIGKRVNNVSMLDDQKDILDKIIHIIEGEAPDAVLIAGDVYDKGIPSEEAVELFDDFLCRVVRLGTKVCVIAGNHDSNERIAFGGRIMAASGVYLSPVYDGSISKLTLSDAGGETDIWLMPFLRPTDVRQIFPEEKLENYTDALRVVIEHMPIDTSKRNIAVGHQFIVGAQTCESESFAVGGLDSVNAEVYAPFDYVALGHLHGPQKVGRETIRYAGTPLKYSFSEVNHKKSVTVIESEKKGDMRLRTVPLQPKTDWIRVKGSFDELARGEGSEAYAEITLTDKKEVMNAMSRLRGAYPNIMTLNYEVYGGGEGGTPRYVSDSRTPIDFFAELYKAQLGRDMDREEFDIMDKLIREIEEGTK